MLTIFTLCFAVVEVGTTGAQAHSPKFHNASDVEMNWPRVHYIASLRRKIINVRGSRCLSIVQFHTRANRTQKSKRSAIIENLQQRLRYAERHGDPNCWTKFNNRDFDLPLRRAAKTFSISFSWIHACSHAEGNNHNGPPVSNREGSGAFGWMQFMRGTFYAHVKNAFNSARAKGDRPPLRFRLWGSRVGQAYTAAYMFSRGWSGQWAASPCN